MSRRPFRFGVQTRTATSRASWVELARSIEDRGYSSITMPDHLDDQLSPTVALMAAADATETLRIGALVWCNDYRHPVMLAKETATLDLLSDGRLELGLGAGWMTSDYEAASIPLDRPGIRLERLAETVEIVRGLAGPGPFTHHGTHYTVNNLNGTPKPVQDPVPLLLGGGGPRMLRLAGRLADIVGVNPNLASGAITADTARDATAERFDQKLAWVRDGAGDRFDAIELQLRMFIVSVTDDRLAVAEALAGGLGLTVEEGLASPLALVGTVEQIADDLRQRRDRYGFSYIVVGEDEFEAFAPVVALLAGT